MKNVQCRTVPEKQEETFVKYVFVLLLTTAVNTLSSVKKGLVKILFLSLSLGYELHTCQLNISQLIID